MAGDREYPVLTRRSGYRYLFTSKHHGGGSSTDSCWRSDVTHDEEFSVFDNADSFEIIDERGWLYGVLSGDGELRDLGTWNQQIAEFPLTGAGVPWHGYPIWAVNHEAPGNRKGEKMRPSKQVFLRLEEVGLITARQRKRLLKGDLA